MIKIDKQDYYFGAALSVFFTQNKDSKPSLVESKEASARSYLMISDTSPTFYMYMKCRTGATISRDGSLSWSITFTSKERQLIQQYINERFKTYIVLLCNEKEFYNTRIAVLTQNEYLLCTKDKSSFTIKLEMKNKRFAHSFTVYTGEGPFSIKCNRFEGKITDISDDLSK